MACQTLSAVRPSTASASSSSGDGSDPLLPAVTETLTAPISEPITEPVTEAAAPVVAAAEPVVAPVTEVVAPVVESAAPVAAGGRGCTESRPAGSVADSQQRVADGPVGVTTFGR